MYEILRIWVAVFVVEQNCAYQELDGKDRRACHVFLKDGGKVQAHLRVLDPGISFEEASIGRVIAVKRRCGLGSRILAEGVRAQLERMKELCKERNNLYEKQTDLKGQKWKIEKSLER